MKKSYPLIAPCPPRLSTMGEALAAIEARGIYSNGGPVVRDFEAAATEKLFGGQGDCLAVSSATLGLMLAIRQAAGETAAVDRLALIPSFTFAATAQAALWAGLTPVLYDTDPESWLPDHGAEEALLRRFGERIAVIVPYATFGAPLDLDHYAGLAERHGVGIVVDAAASLGTSNRDGFNFGAGAPFPIVYSMHATKTFATAEGGLVHSGNRALIEDMRRMSNFGFGPDRSAILPGLNAKLPEIAGLLAHARLDELDAVCAHQTMLDDAYRARLGALALPPKDAPRQAMQFFSVLLPAELAEHRDRIIASLAGEGIGAGHYFSPHLAQQPYFRAHALIEPCPVADDIAARILSLPITDRMDVEDVDFICHRLTDAISREGSAIAARVAATASPAPAIFSAVMIGGGPAGTAVLTAASKAGLLPAFANGLAIVERDTTLGRGELGDYAIRSDSTAETFLTAVRDNPCPELAALIDHPTARHVARYIGDLGAPLTTAGAFVAATGTVLNTLVDAQGGSVLTRHEALSARRLPGGLWQVTVRDPQGVLHHLTTRSLISATGGFQSEEAAASAEIAGGTLSALVGERLMRADDFMRVGGLDALRTRLNGSRAPRVAIIGASTSAVASAALLLKANPALPFGAGALMILHRHPLHPFYPSAEAAREDHFEDFGAQDICPLSGFVYRLGGFRLEARELVLRMLAVGGRVPDPRVALHAIDRMSDAAIRALLDEADVVIAATGYRPHAFPLFDEQDQPIRLRSDEGGALVDRHCRMIRADGQPVPDAYAIGLAAGFVPSGPLGGEASFRGQANGLWLWQNDIGRMIVDQVMRAAQEAAA